MQKVELSKVEQDKIKRVILRNVPAYFRFFFKKMKLAKYYHKPNDHHWVNFASGEDVPMAWGQLSLWDNKWQLIAYAPLAPRLIVNLDLNLRKIKDGKAASSK